MTGEAQLELAVFRPATRPVDDPAQPTAPRPSRSSAIPPWETSPIPGDYEGTAGRPFRPCTGRRPAIGSSASQTAATDVAAFGDPSRGDVPAGASQTAVVAPVPYNISMTDAEWASLHRNSQRRRSGAGITSSSSATRSRTSGPTRGRRRSRPRSVIDSSRSAGRPPGMPRSPPSARSTTGYRATRPGTSSGGS